MLSLCCFSKNRPLQLDAFLRSLKENASYFSDVHVLYLYDNDDFQKGYEIIQKEHSDINFHLESNFKDQILNLVSNFKPYFAWATDDSLFYRNHELNDDKIDWAFNQEQAISINLRIGLNIIWQNHWYSEKVPKIPVKSKYKDLITWDSSNISVQNDVGRLWQNDASIMPQNLYFQRLQIEDHWYKHRGCRGLDNIAQSGNIFNPRIGSCFENSVYINMPVNLVHLLDDGRLFADNWGKYVQQDIFTLNHKLLDGYRIDWKSLDFSNVDCGRMERPYEFYKK